MNMQKIAEELESVRFDKDIKSEQIVQRTKELIEKHEPGGSLLRRAVLKYVENSGVRDSEEQERLFAGVLGFLWVNMSGESYMPLFMYPTIETKKWWQFWKKQVL